MAYKVFLDAGHGGYDNGAVGFGRTEKDDNLELTLAVGEILQENGVDVGYTRVEDVYDSPVRKAQIANEAGADLFVSFHRNSSPQANQYQGVQTLVYDETGLKKEVADAVNAALEEVGFVNLGTEERKNLAVLRRTEMPSLLIEAGFINSETDNAIFEESFDEMARAIASAIYTTLDEKGLLEAGQGTASSRGLSGMAGEEESFAGNMMSGDTDNVGQTAQEWTPENWNRQSRMTETERNENGMQGNNASNRMSDSRNMGNGMQGNNALNRMSDSRQMDNGNWTSFTDPNTVNPNMNSRWGIQYGCWREECTREPAYQIQTGLFRNYMNAVRMKANLERDGYPATIQLYKDLFAVRTGYYPNVSDAKRAEGMLRSLGYDTLIMTIK